MPKDKSIPNQFGVERDGKLVRIKGLKYKCGVEDAINLTAHLVHVLKDKREALEEDLVALEG